MGYYGVSISGEHYTDLTGTGINWTNGTDHGSVDILPTDLTLHHTTGPIVLDATNIVLGDASGGFMTDSTTAKSKLSLVATYSELRYTGTSFNGYLNFNDSGDSSIYYAGKFTIQADQGLEFYAAFYRFDGLSATGTLNYIDATNTLTVSTIAIDGNGLFFASSYGIDSIATGGSDVLNIGATNANVINYGNSSTTHNFLGTAIYEMQVNSYVTDKLMTLNYGGTVASGIGVGFEIEENSVVTGYFKTNAARNAFSILTPSIAYKCDLSLANLTADRIIKFPDATGTLVLAGTTLASYGITDAQPLDSDLTTIAGLTATTDNFIVSVASAWSSRTPAQVRTTLGLVIGTNVQAWDADLDTISGLTATTDNFMQSKAGAWASRTIAQVQDDLEVDFLQINIFKSMYNY
jgi:hypothetical protein